MDTSHLREIPIPDSLPEPIKKVLAKKNEEIRKKRELIENDVEYDEQTLTIFNNFIKDFQTLYPGILTDEEIMLRLKANIKHNIRFADIKIRDDNSNNIVSGLYNSENKIVLINTLYIKSLKENNRDLINAVIFHELLHSLVNDNPYDDVNDHMAYEDGNFINESIITLMEEDYVRKLLNKKFNRVNFYIPTYAKELRIIFGDDLIKTFIQKYKCIEGLFPKKEEFSIYSHDLIDDIDNIYRAVKLDVEGLDVPYLNKNAELGIATVLDRYLEKNKDLSDEEKLNRIVELAKIQYNPDFNVFQNMIKKHIKNMNLIENNPVAKLLYYKDERVLGNLRFSNNVPLLHMCKKLDNFNACGLFGANEIIDVKEEFNEEALPIYDQDKCRHYFKNIKLYEVLNNCLEEEKITLEDLNIISLEKYSYKDRGTHHDIRDEIDRGSLNAIGNLFYGLNANQDVYKCRTKDKEYYIDTDFSSDIMFPKSIDDTIIEFTKIIKEETEEELIRAYMDGIEKLKALKEKNIDTVYTNDFKFIYEENGIVHVFSQQYYDKNTDKERGRYEETKIKLKKVAPPNINIISKRKEL